MVSSHAPSHWLVRSSDEMFEWNFCTSLPSPAMSPTVPLSRSVRRYHWIDLRQAAACGLYFSSIWLEQLPCEKQHQLLLLTRHFFPCCSRWLCCFGSGSRWLMLRFSPETKTLSVYVCSWHWGQVSHFKAVLFYSLSINFHVMFGMKALNIMWLLFSGCVLLL